ncbi:MAG: 30S ribosomal protein S1 [Chloroflexi bacterium]|nr:30S ribosomal protein S1 [Chloroflexota bacterium]
MNREHFADQTAPEQVSEETEAFSMEQFLSEEALDAYDFQALRRGDIRTGVIIRKDEAGVIVDVGHKREGYVPANDLDRLDDDVRARVAVGEEIPVAVIQPEDKEGRPLLSIHQAVLQEDWLKAEQLMESNALFEGVISDYNRGGVVVQFGRIRGFVPASQIVGVPRRLREEERNERLAGMIGQAVGLRVIEVDRRRRRLIFSQRRAMRAWQEKQREQVMQELTEGEVRRGRVSDITGFGAFVDLGGADGLVHVSELSWKRVNNPREVLSIGDEVEVYVLSVDRERKRIALSLKKLQPDPWTQVDDVYHVGQLIEGRVTRVVDFGAFVELDLGIEGLLHASEMIGTPELKPTDIVHPDEVLLVKIIRIESHRRRLALSAKQIRRDEWERWMAQQQIVSEVEAAEESEVAEESDAIAVPDELEQPTLSDTSPVEMDDDEVSVDGDSQSEDTDTSEPEV